MGRRTSKIQSGETVLIPPVPSCWHPESKGEPFVGAHLGTARRGYTHHGVYVGAGKVVHYAGLSRYWRAGPVEEVPISRFSLGHPVWVVKHSESTYSSREIVRRARSRLGETAYQLLSNNCEHFCNWCVSGQSRSAQIEEPSKLFARTVVLAASIIQRLRARRPSLAADWTFG